MMIPRERKRLLVEGTDDLYAIAELIGHHVEWPSRKEHAPVRIEWRDGVENILDEDTIPVRLKAPDTDILGVVIDADDEIDRRWRRISTLCAPFFSNIPIDLPPGGLITKNEVGKYFGIWIMPDNQKHGMLETFLRYLVPGNQASLWSYAERSTGEALNHGANYKSLHSDKAQIHTWLAWADPPGERFGTALLKKILDANAPSAAPFVQWFKELYQL